MGVLGHGTQVPESTDSRWMVLRSSLGSDSLEADNLTRGWVDFSGGLTRVQARIDAIVNFAELSNRLKTQKPLLGKL